MKVEIFRLASQPVTLEVDGDEASIKTLFSSPGSGAVLGNPDLTFMQVANERGGLSAIGNLRVNGVAATLDTVVKEGDTILLIPAVEGGDL